MRIEALLAPGAPVLRLLTDAGTGLDREITGVVTTDLRDPGRYLRGGELVLTGMLWRGGPEDSERFVRSLAEAGAVALAAGEAEVGPVPEDLVRACARHGVPLFAVPEATAFSAVADHVERAGDLAALLDRHRLLVSGAGGLDAVLDLLGGALGLDCWLLTPTGDLAAGAGERLAPPARAALARAGLAAQRAGAAAPFRVDGAAGTAGAVDAAAGGFTLLPVPVEGAEARPLSDWLLAVAEDGGAAGAGAAGGATRRRLAENLAALASAARARRAEERAMRGRLADALVARLLGGADATAVARALAAAEAAYAADGRLPAEVVAVSVHADGAGAPGAEELRAALDEALAPHAPRLLTAVTGTDVVALLPARAAAAAEQPSGEQTVGAQPGGERAAAEWAVGGQAADGRAADEQAADGQAADEQAADGQAAREQVARERAVGEGSVGKPAAGEQPAGEQAAGGPQARLAGWLAARLAPWEAGLAPAARVRIGVSGPVADPAALRGAVEEARHARQAADAGPGRVAVSGPEGIASHALLLAAVPEDVRRAFRERLLGPVEAYDREHQADLLPTLAEFLRRDGAWTRCAAALHVHVNTVRYRIGRIEELTGRDLSRLEHRVDFYLALRLPGPPT